MNILFFSPAFYPSMGGLEAVVAMLAEGLTALGCQVRIVTTTPDNGDGTVFPYEVVRSPRCTEMLSLVRWCDVFFHHNVSLKGLWPLFLVRRTWVVLHHGWYTRLSKVKGWQDHLKISVSRFATNIAVSRAVAGQFTHHCTVISNPYRDDLFRKVAGAQRDKGLVFLGRLVSDKGCNLLLDALALLAEDNLRPGLTIIGCGPEEGRLREQARQTGIADQVTFAGRRSGGDLARLLNEHAIMVIPSIVSEGFGIVALEGMACGCVVIASDAGGLPEALGPCGISFPNGDVPALADCIATLLGQQDRMLVNRDAAPAHLAEHRRAFVVQQYFAVLKQATDLGSRA